MSKIDGTWFAAEAPLTFLLQQQEGAVVGAFHDEKVFTCELKGSFAANKLIFNFETIFSWLNVHDMGSAALDLSADGATLSGPVLMGGKQVRWTLTRTRPPVRAPAAAPPPAPPPAPPKPVRSAPSGGSGERRLPYRDRITKEVWDAEHDEALRSRLNKRAQVEPELRELLKKKKLLDPKK